MTVPVWPTELPRPECDTWNAQFQDARLKRRSDAGPASFRRRFSSASKSVRLSTVLTRDERAVFDNFFDRATGKGVTPFWMPDPTTDGWALKTGDGAPLLIAGGPDDGKPLLLAAQWLCVFGEQMPVETVIGTRFRMSFSVEVLP